MHSGASIIPSFLLYHYMHIYKCAMKRINTIYRLNYTMYVLARSTYNANIEAINLPTNKNSPSIMVTGVRSKVPS